MQTLWHSKRILTPPSTHLSNSPTAFKLTLQKSCIAHSHEPCKTTKNVLDCFAQTLELSPKRKCCMSNITESQLYVIRFIMVSNLWQRVKEINGYFVVISGMQLFPAAHSNTFPFILLIFLERQFPPCTRASHILCKMPRNSTLPFTFYLCSQYDYLSFYSIFSKSHSPLFCSFGMKVKM